jgi:hypothetical protein
MEDEERVTFGIRRAVVRGMDERFCLRVVLIKTRLYRLHRHREFKRSGMRCCVVQTEVIDVSKGSFCLHFESEESPVWNIQEC